jgi:hypothetical protein
VTPGIQSTLVAVMAMLAGPDKESNWLPAPKDKFILMLRLYWPNETTPSRGPLEPGLMCQRRDRATA